MPHVVAAGCDQPQAPFPPLRCRTGRSGNPLDATPHSERSIEGEHLRLSGWHRAQAQLGRRGPQCVASCGDWCEQRGLSGVLGICEGAKEDKAGWSSFLKHLKERGLAGVRLIISDACLGLSERIGRWPA